MRYLSPLLLCMALAGCAAAAASPVVDEFVLSKNRGMVAATAAAGHLDKPDVGPAKPDRKDCKVCNGTGKVRSGDGHITFDCTACVPAVATNSPAIPESSEIAFGGPTIRGNRSTCDCQTSGLCSCGDSCVCQGPRTRVAYLYTTTPCAPCDRMKAGIEAAAKSGRLPADIRIVLRDAPDWVASFPTIHFQAGGIWHQTSNIDTFIRDCNGLVSTQPIVTNPVAYYSTPHGDSCSAGTCSSPSFFSGGCAGGSCGGGASRGFFCGYSGWSGGGGCASCSQ